MSREPSGPREEAQMQGIHADETGSASAEIEKVRSTAQRLAEGRSEEGGNQIRVLAGLTAQLAHQVERLARSVAPSPLATSADAPPPGENRSDRSTS